MLFIMKCFQLQITSRKQLWKTHVGNVSILCGIVDVIIRCEIRTGIGVGILRSWLLQERAIQLYIFTILLMVK